MTTTETPVRFHDRAEAGRLLARSLAGLRGGAVVVLGVPRGGVPVAAQVAGALGAPLDVVVVGRIPVPGRPELALGAVGEDGTVVLNDHIAQQIGADPCEVGAAVARARAQVRRRACLLRGPGRQPAVLTGRVAVIVDDGIATAATTRAACRVVRARGASRIVVAAPVAAPTGIAALADVADDVVCLRHPACFVAVGQFYEDFAPTTDSAVLRALAARPGRGRR